MNGNSQEKRKSSPPKARKLDIQVDDNGFCVVINTYYHYQGPFSRRISPFDFRPDKRSRRYPVSLPPFLKKDLVVVEFNGNRATANEVPAFSASSLTKP